MRRLALVLIAFALTAVSAFAQKPSEGSIKESQTASTPSNNPPTPPTTASAEQKEKAEKDKDDATTGIVLPNNDRLRIRVRLLAGYGLDDSQSSLGFEKQGRVGYAIVDMFGKLNKHLRYRVEINPVHENQPGVSCGEKDFFYPNAAQPIGPTVACDNNGRQRVDDYRFVALDPLMQQGPIRQAYIAYNAGRFGVQFGRFIAPIGFGWEEVGSFTAKDATHIQRINAEASFGVQFGLTKQYKGRKFATVSVAGTAGDGNKFHDYNYFYGIDGSLDSNSWPTMILSGTFTPTAKLDLRATLKKGNTGSKIERLPNFFATKRNDDALVLSARYRPFRYMTVFGEHARYTWGLMKTSAELLGQSDTNPVKKAGYYIGGDFNRPITEAIRLGTTITREELSRDDSLIKYLAAQGLYRASVGKKERSTVYRFYVEISRRLTIGVYRNNLSNPFPWVSSIQPVAGERAFTGRGNNKWGVIARFTLQ